MAAGVASPTSLNVLAGIAGQGGTPSLAWFAPPGTALPTDATTALAAAYLSAGYCAETGVNVATATASTDINAFGVTVPVRTLVTSEKRTGSLTMLETNLVSQAVYRKLPLPGSPGGVSLATGGASTGAIQFTEGQARVQSYVMVITASDGTNLIRKVFPNVQITDKADETISQAAAITYGVTYTAFPDSTGAAVYTYMVVPNLATS
jgi:hypothetical protein